MKKIILTNILLIVSILSFTGCGKHESEGGATGLAAGALVGAAVSGKHDKGAGTAIGALIGNTIGRVIGRAEDRVEAKNEEELKELRRRNRELHARRARRREKWCSYCVEKINIDRATCCPYCGNDLVVEKYCKRCYSSFAPESSYSYCPYCPVRMRLCSR